MKTGKIIKYFSIAAIIGALFIFGLKSDYLEASSHREAPFIANDPLADNTDVYAFRSPDQPDNIILIANYVPAELPQGGPNYYSFGENIRYEIHVKNDPTSTGDDIVYRFTFTKTNEDPTTFFNIRLGKQNLKTTYKAEKSIDGGVSFSTIVTDGIVPPPNIGPRSIEDATVGLGTTYEQLMTDAIATASSGETIFCGSIDDPFFVDLGGIFDLANIRPTSAIDGLAGLNTHAIVIKVPISSLQKDGKAVSTAKDILDSDFIIGVWASASRPSIRTLNPDGGVTESGNYVQVSRLGMPLTNEVIIPIGHKDKWNAQTPYTEDKSFEVYFTNPELALYMDDSKFGGAVPGFADLRIQAKSLGLYDFRNGQPGLFPLKGSPAVDGTALADAAFGNYLLRDAQPRSVDILPIFHTGVPNLPPYQLATGKANKNPLAPGKPFVNNFLPVFGDMLRLNMAVPPTPRNDPNFSSEGLLASAVIGLTVAPYNTTSNLEFIPNMDGFPNGRRLEDDVTRIELQAVSGVVLAALGLWYDDYNPLTSPSPLTPDLQNVISFTTGVEKNDTVFKAAYPYVQTPWDGFFNGTGKPGIVAALQAPLFDDMNLGAPAVLAYNYPNPFQQSTTIKYKINSPSDISIKVYDLSGKLVSTVLNEYKSAGIHETAWNSGNLKEGIYVATIAASGKVIQSIKLNVIK